MFDRFPCLWIKRRKPNGYTCEVEIRPSLLGWLLVGGVTARLRSRLGTAAHSEGWLASLARCPMEQMVSIVRVNKRQSGAGNPAPPSASGGATGAGFRGGGGDSQGKNARRNAGIAAWKGCATGRGGGTGEDFLQRR